MEAMKFEILFVKYNRDFTKELCSHFTTVERLTTGADPFDYDSAEIVARRQFTGFVGFGGTEIYQGDHVSVHCDDGEVIKLGTVEWFKPWGGWAIMSDGTPLSFGDEDSAVADFRVTSIEVTGNKFELK